MVYKEKDSRQNVENPMAFDSIRDLRLFVRIYQQGSISAASELLGITVAVASKRLKRLEGQAGEALFHRSTRRLSPTGAGALLYDHALSIITLAEDAQAQLTSGSEPNGFMRITASVAFVSPKMRLAMVDSILTYIFESATRRQLWGINFYTRDNSGQAYSRG